MMKPGSIEETREVIRSNDHLLAFGGRSKTALEAPVEIMVLDLSSLSGILEYDPSEYTFTALAGTRLDEIEAMLEENGQFLPFDPPFIDRGGTIGGTIAAGVSGSGRYRYGGLRDFVIGINFLNDEGNLIHSGGKVVKNAAGFDIPKLMVGSCGSFGALAEVSVKVFPRPEEYISIQSEFASLREALDHLVNLTASPIELFCLDLKPNKSSTQLIIRLGGVPGLFPNRIERLEQELGDIEIIQGDDELLYWRNEREFNWISEDTTLVKIPVTTRHVTHLDEFLAEHDCERRYSVGANLAWVAWSKPIESLDRYLMKNGLPGMTILGPPVGSRIGSRNSGSFYQRIKSALDPHGKWAEV
jgi:glycolate oxidase FAD binding subunit